MTQLGPDPRFGMAAPIEASHTITTPEGLESTVTMSRSVTLDPQNPFGVQQQTEQISIGGRIFETTFEAGDANEPATVTRTTHQGRQVVSQVDALGRTTRVEIHGLYPVTQEYDTDGRLTSIAQGPDDPNHPAYADRRVTTFTYKTTSDNQNRLLGMITDPEGRETSFDYDDAGRVKKQTLPDLREIEFDYDANGNLTSLTPPGRPAHEFDYTPVNLESEYIPPQPSPPIPEPRTQFVYNADRQLEEIVRPDGQTVDYEYGESDGRLQSVSAGSDVRNYIYYGAQEASPGQLKTLSGPDATLGFTYDGHLLLQESWNWDDLANDSSVTRTYDDDLRMTSLQVDAQTPIAFDYDGDGMLTQAGDLTLTRDPDNGFLTGTILAGGGSAVEDTFTYSPFGEIATYAAEYDSSEIYSYSIDGRDKLGRITDRTETVTIAPNPPVTTTRHFEYDPAGRLWKVCDDDTCTNVLSEYLYDQNGNRTGGTIGGEAISATYDDQDRLLSYTRGSTTHTYTYGENGELESKTNTSTSETTSYIYDAFGNLRGVTLPDETEIEYLIDGRNRRIGKKVNGDTIQRLVYRNRLNVVAQLNGQGEMVSEFIYGLRPNVPDYVLKGASIYRILTDRLGSVRLVVDLADGSAVQRIEYDEFGTVLVDTNPTFQPFGFAGGIYDGDTDLVRFGERDYDTASGRWLSKDRVGFAGKDTNLYAYVMNSPINWIDPLGREILICSRKTAAGIGNHAYGWDSSTGTAHGMDGSSGTPGGEQDERGPNGGDKCNLVPDSKGREKEFTDHLDATANEGPWIPVVNDCHQAIDESLDATGLPDTEAPGGRLGEPSNPNPGLPPASDPTVPLF